MAARKAVRVPASRKGWKARGSAPLSWEEGLEVQGTFVRLQPKGDGPNAPGAIATLDVTDSETGEILRVRYWAPTILANRLQDDFEPGEEILIVCLGKNVPSKRGQDAWGFEVYGKE